MEILALVILLLWYCAISYMLGCMFRTSFPITMQVRDKIRFWGTTIVMLTVLGALWIVLISELFFE